MYLLDTNALIYYLYDNNRLTDKAKGIIYGVDSLAISIASLWEIAIKASLGKLTIKSSIGKIAETCRDEGIAILPIKITYLDKVHIMPWIHKDPFDRLIVATADAEKMSVVSSDQTISGYGVNVIW